MLFTGLDTLNSSQQVTFMLWMSVSQAIATVLALLVIGLRYRYAPRIFGWQPEFLSRDLRLGLVAFVAVV